MITDWSRCISDGNDGLDLISGERACQNRQCVFARVGCTTAGTVAHVIGKRDGESDCGWSHILKAVEGCPTGGDQGGRGGLCEELDKGGSC